jgi:hypothetical protein
MYSVNSGSNGSVTMGVQQSYNIVYKMPNKEVKNIGLNCTAYPNPATDFFILKIDKYSNLNISLQLYNEFGSVLKIQKIEDAETRVIMSSFAPGSYFVKVSQENREVETFKIIKL